MFLRVLEKISLYFISNNTFQAVIIHPNNICRNPLCVIVPSITNRKMELVKYIK